MAGNKVVETVDYTRGDGKLVKRNVIRCNCGSEVLCGEFTNTCSNCGRDYNMSGQLLAPREQWGEDTGESLSDILIGSDD